MLIHIRFNTIAYKPGLQLLQPMKSHMANAMKDYSFHDGEYCGCGFRSAAPKVGAVSNSTNAFPGTVAGSTYWQRRDTRQG